MMHRDSCPAGPLGPLFGECNCAATVDALKWVRIEPGRYVAGPYVVTNGAPLSNSWFARGPGGETVGVPQVHRTKALAQRACAEAAAYNARRAVTQ